jgi:prepilin-type N-terminal cleavage/methylation domain-containing protein
MNRRREARAGVTLVETVVAMAIFAVGIIFFAPLLVSTVRANDAAAVRGRAVGLAQEKAEELRLKPFDDLAAGADNPPGGYSREWGLLDVPDLPGDAGDLKRVFTTVSWSLPGRGAGSVTLTLSRARY